MALTSFVLCPNPTCHKFTLYVSLHGAKYDGGDWRPDEQIQRWQLIPPSNARSFPDFVPEAVRSDYEEACLIRDLSPKSSATLARRAIQGMIRDFWNVKGLSRLKDEIDAIKGEVDLDTWEAIDTVRKVGNIGAHMEQDINLIIEVEPEEAGMLIWLVEQLINDWYMARNHRQQGLRDIAAIKDAKDAAKKS